MQTAYKTKQFENSVEKTTKMCKTTTERQNVSTKKKTKMTTKKDSVPLHLWA